MMSTRVMSEHKKHDLQSRPPKRTATNLSADFVESSIALAEDSYYVPERDKFVSAEEAKISEDEIAAIWKDAQMESVRLQAATQSLREKTHPTGSKEASRMSNLTWKEVIAEVNTATATYQNSAFAKMCDRSGAFEQWLSLLPNDSYCSAISGAFVMGVQATRSISGIQKSIYETLASIPDVLEHASRYVEIYKAHRSYALVRSTAELCKSILITLRLIVDFITKKSIKIIGGALLKGTNFQQKLKDSMDDMKLNVERVREEASVCMQMRIAAMDRKADLRYEQEKRRHLHEKEEICQKSDSLQSLLNNIYRYLQSGPGYDVKTGGLEIPKLLATGENENVGAASDTYVNVVTIKSLLAALDADSDQLQDDIDYCLKLGFSETPAFQDRAAWVLQSQRIGDFLDGDAGSKLLLINGNHDPTTFLSPLSYACAKMVDLMNVSDKIICLSYFCSRHTDTYREPRANEQGLLAELTGQLLRQLKGRKRKRFELDLRSLTAEDETAIEQDDFSATWRAFEAIITHLPKKTVIFCFIDALSAYQNATRKRNTNALMRKLCRIIRKSKNVSLRCMVTCPGRALDSNTWGIEFDGKRADRLEVPEDL